MKNIFFLIAVICFISFTTVEKKTSQKDHATTKDTIPSFVLGNFMDDYGIRYSVSDSVFLQHPNIKYHIIRWNTSEQYIIVKNGDKNPSEPGLYSRIDYMSFQDMDPFLWGFCLTVYNAKTDSLAEFSAKADRQNPRKGCNGYPFSRMKKL